MTGLLHLSENIEHGIASLIEFCGDTSEREGMRDTPKRVLKAYEEMTSGYKMDPEKILSTRFACSSDEMVLVKGIEFVSLCEHHLLPFVGTAAVAYLPDCYVIGLSKIPRLVQCYAKRFQLQERLTTDIASAFNTHLRCRGVGVVLRAKHSCMGCRGAMQPNAEMVTSCTLGAFRDDLRTRSEFLSLVS